jgi:hypothetical protein
MDDVRPVQRLQEAIARGAWLFIPRTAYEWTLHENDEGTYTEYAASNPPYGVTITFYQSAPQKSAPALEILDARGRVIRNVSGTHKVGGKEQPYVQNKAGLNRYTWDFTVNGPVKWNAVTTEFLNPQTGPGVPPGEYAVRMALSGHTYVQHFRVAPDPRSHFTQADYERSYNEAMRQMGHLSQLDTMLNQLDDVKKQLDTALTTLKKNNNAALATTLQSAADKRQALADSLATNIRGEGTEDETKLREDVFGAFEQAQGLITPAVSEFITRVDGEYREGIARYNAFVTGVLPGVNAALQQAGMKTLPTVKTVTVP